MKRSLIFLFFQIALLSAFSQNSDVIYLKNGSILKGKIIQIRPGENVKFETSDGSIWVFDYADLLKFDNTDALQTGLIKLDSTRNKYLIADMGFLVGTTNNDMKAPLSILAVYDVPIYNKVYAGIGTGLEFFEMTYIPVIAELRFKRRTIGPSIYFQAGYTMPIKKEGTVDNSKYSFEPGILINPGISYTFGFSQGTAFTISIGYRYQKTSAKQLERYYNDDYLRIDKLNRMNLRFGYSFR
jgi:hypothetical protein